MAVRGRILMILLRSRIASLKEAEEPYIVEYNLKEN